MNIIRVVTGPPFVRISPDSFLKFLSASATIYFGGRGLTGLLEDASLGKEAVHEAKRKAVLSLLPAHILKYSTYFSVILKNARAFTVD
jgi:hypothetical protein